MDTITLTLLKLTNVILYFYLLKHNLTNDEIKNEF